MKDNKIALQLRLDEQTHKKVKFIASRELRSLNAQFEFFILKGIADYEKEHGSIDPAQLS